MTKETIAKLSVGDKAGRLTILEIIPGHRGSDGKKIKSMARCRCSCGNSVTAGTGDVKSQNTKSCGCLRGESHGGSYVPEYNIWRAMKARCTRATQPDYASYGARGITVCERWKNSFANFLLDMGERPSKKHSIDRRDNDASYSPNNCRWASAQEQSENRRNSKPSVIKTCAACSKVFSVKHSKKSKSIHCSRSCRHSYAS